MVNFSFLKKLRFPGFPFEKGSSRQAVGIDIGMSSTKVVELRYESERALLQTYGELRNEKYLKKVSTAGAAFLRYLDNDIAALLKDIL